MRCHVSAAADQHSIRPRIAPDRLLLGIDDRSGRSGFSAAFTTKDPEIIKTEYVSCAQTLKQSCTWKQLIPLAHRTVRDVACVGRQLSRLITCYEAACSYVSVDYSPRLNSVSISRGRSGFSRAGDVSFTKKITSKLSGLIGRKYAPGASSS